MNIPPRRPIFNRRAESNAYRVFTLVLLILGGVWLIIQFQQGGVKSPLAPPPTPTRTSDSFRLEGEAQFTAGDLDKSIAAYQEAARLSPADGQVWTELARIQIYSSSTQITDAQISQRLADGLKSAQQAVTVAPDESSSHAVLAFALDWNANPTLVDADQVQKLLTQADQEAIRALQLDATNTLALAYYAEILVDQQKWVQGQQYIEQAVNADPTLMDVHRVYAYVLESLQQYNLAIAEYDKAIAITPKLTFLYLRAGANYRQLGFMSPNPTNQAQYFAQSLEYFAKAAAINEELKIDDPAPYLSIAKTYSQQGDYFIAARNVQKVLSFEPTNPDFYGQLGIIFFKARNYEGSIPTLLCAIKGCSGEDSCLARGVSACDAAITPVTVQPLLLSSGSVDYYQVYFSVLAALGPRDASYCPRALEVIRQVQASGLEAQRPDITANIAAALLQCSGGTGATQVPTAGLPGSPSPSAVAPTATP